VIKGHSGASLIQIHRGKGPMERPGTDSTQRERPIVGLAAEYLANFWREIEDRRWFAAVESVLALVQQKSMQRVVASDTHGTIRM